MSFTRAMDTMACIVRSSDYTARACAYAQRPGTLQVLAPCCWPLAARKASHAASAPL